MTPTQYRSSLKKLDISIVGASQFFGISRRQSQRNASTGPIPKLIAKVIKLMVEGKIKKEDLL